MSTPKRFYAHQRLMYPPDLLPGPPGGALLVLCHALAWKKTGQTLDRGLAGASRPGRCPHDTCAGARLCLRSAAAQRRALPHATSGSDVRGRLGWWRAHHPAPSRELHTALASQVRLSASHGRALALPLALPRLAGPARQHRDPLAQMAPQPGGWLIALAGLAPHGGEPPRWCSRARTRGVP